MELSSNCYSSVVQAGRNTYNPKELSDKTFLGISQRNQIAWFESDCTQTGFEFYKCVPAKGLIELKPQHPSGLTEIRNA